MQLKAKKQANAIIAIWRNVAMSSPDILVFYKGVDNEKECDGDGDDVDDDYVYFLPVADLQICTLWQGMTRPKGRK